MEPITLRELQEAVGGDFYTVTGERLKQADYDEKNRLEKTPVTGAETDNRDIAEGNVFFAFSGENVDGHRFVFDAFQRGAVCCVVSHLPEAAGATKSRQSDAADAAAAENSGNVQNHQNADAETDPNHAEIRELFLLVEDTMLAFGELAAWYRNRFSIPLIAVTGSVGKTTTKEMIAAVLGERFRVLKTEGNFNNHIGVPKTLLRLDKNTEAAVVEMGMNHKGEISYLTGLARPTAAVITNIGDAHIGNLGSREAILEAKCEIFEGLAPDGFAVLNGDDALLCSLRKKQAETGTEAGFEPGIGGQIPQKLYYVGCAEDADVRAENIDDAGQDMLTFTANGYPVTVPAPGRHLIYAASAAFCIGQKLGMTKEEIAAGLLNYAPAGKRMEILQGPSGSGIEILNDTYNANPQSMMAGAVTLSHRENGRRIAVIGDMLELGDQEEALHREVGAYIAGLSIDVLVTVGTAARFAAEEAKKPAKALSEAEASERPDTENAAENTAREGLTVIACADKEEAKKALLPYIQKNTSFWCKASRGMALEEIAAFLQEEAAKLEGAVC